MKEYKSEVKKLRSTEAFFAASYMGDVGLFLSGATLFLNSLMLFGKADNKSVGVFNLFVGALQVIIPFYLITVSDQNHWTIFNLASVFLFGLTYLYVGVINLKGYNGNGLGWFSLWVSVIGIVYAAISFIQFQDIISGLIWILWAYLWLLFFLSMALNKKIDVYVGKVAFVQSWVTLTLPALLALTGVWKTDLVSNIWFYVLMLSFAYFLIITIKLIVTTKSREKNMDVQVSL